MSGRTVLAKATLSSNPSHIMQYIKLPTKITNSINKIQRDFIWGTIAEKRKIHLISWDTITKGKEEGGLGLHKSEVKNRALLASLAWMALKNPNSTWSRVITSKYLNRTNKFVSRTWKNIQGGWLDCKGATRWTIYTGQRVKFFEDTWLPLSNSIRSMIHGPLNIGEDDMLITDLYQEGI